MSDRVLPVTMPPLRRLQAPIVQSLSAPTAHWHSVRSIPTFCGYATELSSLQHGTGMPVAGYSWDTAESQCAGLLDRPLRLLDHHAGSRQDGRFLPVTFVAAVGPESESWSRLSRLSRIP
jgi:hypothetical protein